MELRKQPEDNNIHTNYVAHTHTHANPVLALNPELPMYIGRKCGQANRKNMFYSKLILFDDNIKSFTPNCIFGLPTKSSLQTVYTLARYAFECITFGCMYICLLGLNWSIK